MKEDFINFSEHNNTGIITLTRPKALNALNYKMVKIFLKKLVDWNKNNFIRRVLVEGKGNAFCAGGDIKSLVISANKNEIKKKFFRKEYILNNTINEFSKDYLSVWNGIVMGGGAGLSIYGNYRIATEKTKFAMPETAIGFFPDVGASYFLSKLNKGVGLFLALTGTVINAKDLIDLKLATHYFPSEYISKIKEKFIETGILPTTKETSKEFSELKENANFIEDIFQNDLKNIFKKLASTNNKFGKNIYFNLLKKSPMSLAISTKLINEAKSKSLNECLEIEYQLSQHMVYRKDFNNGVDALLISKTNKPYWNPSSIDSINYEDINKMFEPHVEKLYL